MKNVGVFVLVNVISAFLCFYNLGKAPLAAWDESLYGANAYEMDQHNEWFNPYYEGQPDDWNVKPPFFVNLVRASYRMFGYNEFALRFPSAISAYLILILFYLFLAERYGVVRAILTLSMLWGSTGLIGQHSGRSGDTDALFALFVLLASYGVYKFAVGDKKWGLILAALAAGFGFWTKSTAIALAFPGLILFLLLINSLSLKKLIIPGLIFTLFPMTWILADLLFGIEFENSLQGGNSAWANSLIYDTMNRFLGQGQFEAIPRKPDFMLVFLESRFNLWFILFIPSIIWLFSRMLVYRKELISRIRSTDPVLILSISLCAPFMMLLQLSSNANGWCLIPLLPFVAIITAHGISVASTRFSIVSKLWFVLAILTTVRHASEIVRVESGDKTFYQLVASLQKDGECLIIDRSLEPDQTLYLEWNSKQQCFIEEENWDKIVLKSTYCVLRNDHFGSGEIIAEHESMVLIKR